MAANYFEQTGNKAKAEKYLKELAAIDKLDTGIYLRLLNIYKMDGQLGKSNEMLRIIQQINPNGDDFKEAQKSLA